MKQLSVFGTIDLTMSADTDKIYPVIQRNIVAKERGGETFYAQGHVTALRDVEDMVTSDSVITCFLHGEDQVIEEAVASVRRNLTGWLKRERALLLEDVSRFGQFLNDLDQTVYATDNIHFEDKRGQGGLSGAIKSEEDMENAALEVFNYDTVRRWLDAAVQRDYMNKVEDAVQNGERVVRTTISETFDADAQQKAHDEGLAAARSGKYLSDNPYRKIKDSSQTDMVKLTAWEDGWHGGQERR